MNLDLNTLLYACIAVVTLAAAILAFFGATQGTHPGFRWWVVAQSMLVAGLLLDAVFHAYAFAVPLAALLIVQWPVVVLAGMRRMHMRKRPAVPAVADWGVLALAAGGIVIAWASEASPAQGIAAFALGAFMVNLYAAVLTTRLGGFAHSFALKALVAAQGATAALEAICLMFATVVESTGPRGLAPAELSAQLALVIPALALVPVALTLTYERTLAKMQATHRKLRHLADIDVLTRLPNRRHFHDLATRTLATTETAHAAVLMFDIENLKRINDLLGPSTGDEALRQVGIVLRETLRARDVAGRVGGDEFAAMLPETSVADAVRVAGRITARLEDRQVAPRTAHLTLNVGAVQMRAGDTIVEAMRRADLALDDARYRHQGRATSAQDLVDTVPAAPHADLDPKPA